MTDVFKVLTDPTRRAILDELGMSRRAISRQLDVIESADLVRTLRE